MSFCSIPFEHECISFWSIGIFHTKLYVTACGHRYDLMMGQVCRQISKRLSDS
jgi:hypothetical protein